MGCLLGFHEETAAAERGNFHSRDSTDIQRTDGDTASNRKERLLYDRFDHEATLPPSGDKLGLAVKRGCL